MAAEHTIRINDDLYQQVEQYAEITGQTVEEVIARTVESQLPKLNKTQLDRPLRHLSDQEVLALADLMMDEQDSARHRALLDAQQERDLSDTESLELWLLTQQYRVELLRKADGLQEAVLRGLRPRL